MKQTKIERLGDGIVRVRRSEAFPQSLCERYGILTVPQVTETLSPDCRALALKSGRTLSFGLRPDEDDAEWRGVAEYFDERFKDYEWTKKIIQGNPNTVREVTPPQAGSGTSRFGVSFGLSEDERFYGLGEASKTKLELRGDAYQNWTLYQYDEIPIPFIMSSEGWGVLVNAAGRHFVDVGCRNADRLTIAGELDELDIFIFDCLSMTEVIAKYSSLTGKPMLLPKWAYGLTYIAPMYADQFEVLAEAKTFRDEGIPCDMISLEPGWMEKLYDFSTQKKWALERFHIPQWQKSRENPEHMLGALRRMGFHLSLWLCINYDFTDEAEREYLGAEKGTFDPWYKHLEQFVDYGVDGFKLDPATTVDAMHPQMICANGLPQLQMHNLNQVLLPKQMYEGFSRQLGLRPMHHYCGGYMGIQRWSASTTGDNGGKLGAMIWLLTLAMSGHMNTTVDMHVFEPQSIHFGMFVPWAHLNAWSGVRQPWMTDKKLYTMFADYARMRYEMLPYIYSTAIEGHETGIPMIRPMPLAFPDYAPGHENIYQYMFGPWIMITAYTDTVCLPSGDGGNAWEWVDYFTGRRYAGGEPFAYTPPENRGGGLFIRRGAIIPMWRERRYVGERSEEEIFLDVFPCGDSEYLFREDDGMTLDYETRESCHTKIACSESDGKVVVTIGKREGDYRGKPEKRSWLVRVHGPRARVEVKRLEEGCSASYVFMDC